MRVAAIVGVKDESELIARCIDHLFMIGVDQIVVQDYGSTDGTVEYVSSLAGQQVSLQRYDESVDHSVETWGDMEACLARSTDAEWVLLLDADEFWLPAGGSIKRTLSGVSRPAVTVARYNVVLTPAGPCLPKKLSPDYYGDVALYVDRIPDLRKLLDGPEPIAWIRSAPVPKVALRPDAVARIGAGHHTALDASGRHLPQTAAYDMLIAHLPFTTLGRFRRKIENVRRSIQLQGEYHSENRGWHWKRWVERDDRGELDAEYSRQVIEAAELERLRVAGKVRSAAELLDPTVLVRRA